MAINTLIIDTVKPIVSVCVPDIHYGPEKEYCTFNTSIYGDSHGDDEPTALLYRIQLHYFLPNGINPRPVLEKLSRALLQADMVWPEVTNASDRDSQHYVLETEWVGGVPDGESDS